MKMKDLVIDLSKEYGIPEELVMEISELPINEEKLADPTDFKEVFKQQRMNYLTTLADGMFLELEHEGVISNPEKLKAFMDILINFLEANGGRVTGMEYIEEKIKSSRGNE